MSKIGVFKRSHPSGIFLRISHSYSSHRTLSHRFHGPLYRRLEKPTSLATRCQRVFASNRPTTRPTDRHAILARATRVQPMPFTGPRTNGSSSQPPRFMREPAAKRQHAQYLSGFLKTVVVTLGMHTCVDSIRALREMGLGIRIIRAARKRPRIFRIFRILRKRRHALRIIRGFLAFTAFAVFIVYDIRNLSHDEPVQDKHKKTIREDPAAALSDARKELARMMKQDIFRCQ